MSTATKTAPQCCPFCGAALGCIASGKPAIGEDRDWARFECGTYWYREYENQREDQTPICTHAERERLTRGLETCRQRLYEKALRIQDLKSRLQLAQDDLTVRIKEVEKVEQERDALAQKATVMAVQVSEQIKRWDATIRENERLTRELDELRAWKESVMAVEREWDANAIATILGGICGESQRKVIAREVPKLLARVKQLESEWAGWPDLQREWFGDKYAAMQPIEAVRARIEDTEARVQRLEEAGQLLDDVADAADDDIREHLQVANYNLHGLLNTGERIQPPNPPQTIHQAGIDASVAVREDIRKARNAWHKAKEATP